MSWIADHRLIKVADLNIDLALDIGNRPDVPGVAIATDPDIGTSRNRRSHRPALQPLVERDGIATHVGVC